MLKFIVTIVLSSLPLCLFSQVQIGGVINKYYPVVDYNDCGNYLTISTTANLNSGDKVMIIQMKGAIISQSNNSSYGSVLNYNCAGCYEINRVSSVIGSQIYLDFYLENPYDFNSSVQLVYIPEYEDVEVSQLLVPQPWNGMTGGVLALEVNQTLTLNANLDASKMGFKGGDVSVNYWQNGDCATSGYVFTGSNVKYSGFKGESISNINYMLISGRGASANGGGGGNNLNAGGGGGSLYGIGGLGGKEWTGCTGGNVGGIGGYQLSNFENRLYLGGGGGGGHQNNTQSTSGGNGGGIIYIKANEILTNNNSILSAGEGVIAQAGIDGAGGGGAGGVILMDVNQIVGTLNLNVRGGNGGSVNNGFTGGSTGGQCHGPGGGGGGGLVLKTGMTIGNLFINSLGGNPGLTVNNQSSCNGNSFGALAGGGGTTMENIIVKVSNVPVIPCEENEDIEPNVNPFIPNVFTPNADESNDYFSVTGFEDYTDFQVLILNRWGNIMFSSSIPSFKWNGEDQHGVEAKDGVYFYLITGISPYDQGIKEFQGFVHLVR